VFFIDSSERSAVTQDVHHIRRRVSLDRPEFVPGPAPCKGSIPGGHIRESGGQTLPDAPSQGPLSTAVWNRVTR